MKKSTESIKKLLEDHHVRASNYRIRVLQCLDDKKLHPTAEMLYQNLHAEFPTLSKMSVYNTIQVLLKANLIRELTIENNEVRYDSILEKHGHFKCTQCGKIFNFDIDYKSMVYKGLESFEINEQDVFFKGICQDCLNIIPCKEE